MIGRDSFWAVTFPLHYRTAHSKRAANWLIILTWLFVIGLNCPSTILGGLNPVIYPVKFCRMDYRGYIGPLARWGLSLSVTTSPKLSSSSPILSSSTRCVSFVGIKFDKALLLEAFRRADPGCPRSTAARGCTCDLEPPFATSTTDEAERGRRGRDGVGPNFVVGVVVCWTPNHPYYLLVDIINYRNATFLAIQFFVQFTCTWINPILCYMAMRQLREALNDLLFPRP
ncbi:hypothetical protein BV898_19062 [Hypsibius exemplaris]|uniref:G-protein coupled receptors family 1 profile domain-containing protein n=1 Tax=Hypsibius exemplaris TaxID=2072580 RepID=A0A9X6RNR5_HYPEX|nr:hypothetical protein BV898_19062 [Hypsibius exemplaris]